MVGGRYPGTDGSWPAENCRNLAVGAIIIVLIIIIGAAALYHKRTAGVAGALLLMGGLAIGYAALSASKFMASPQESTELRDFSTALPVRTPIAGGGTTSAEDLTSTAFSQSDIDEMLAILASDEKIHKSDEETAQEHVRHCLHQMVRLAHLATKQDGKFRAAQWGLNMGRAQEILRSAGGIDAWWRAFKDIINAEDWPLLKSKSETYIRLLQLDPPDEAFINTP